MRCFKQHSVRGRQVARLRVHTLYAESSGNKIIGVHLLTPPLVDNSKALRGTATWATRPFDMMSTPRSARVRLLNAGLSAENGTVPRSAATPQVTLVLLLTSLRPSECAQTSCSQCAQFLFFLRLSALSSGALSNLRSRCMPPRLGHRFQANRRPWTPRSTVCLTLR